MHIVNPISYGRHDIVQADIDAVTEVLRSDLITQGPVVPRFEQVVADYCGAQHGVAVNSATSALHIACLALDLGPGDWLWTTPNTFVASANCAIYCGASVDFVDIDPRTFCMSVARLSEKLQYAEKAGKLPKVVVPVHLCGQSCDMKAIYALSIKYHFRIVEDASHAIGGRYLDRFVGCCDYSDIVVFSFHPVKIITTGEGGMALTNSDELKHRMKLYRSHGITNDVLCMTDRPSDEIWNYQQICLGYNYRMTDIQAALGLSQMTRLNYYVEKRHAIAKKYDDAFAEFPIQLPWQDPNCYSSYHLYPIRLNPKDVKVDQRSVYGNLRSMGVLANLHYIPVYRQPYFERFGFDVGYCEEAEKYFKEAISLPIYATLTDDQQQYVIAALSNAINI